MLLKIAVILPYITVMPNEIQQDAENSNNKTAVKWWQKEWFYLTVLLCATVAVNYTFVSDGFYFDDQSQIIEGRLIRSVKNIPEIFGTETWRNVQTENRLEFAVIDTYRPVYISSLVLDYQLSGLNPKGYHITNMIIHLINIIFVFFLAGIMGFKQPIWPAALFAVHPAVITSVHYVSGRADSMVTLFALITVITVLTPRPGIKSYVIAFFSFLLAILTKETAILLPFTATVIHWSFHPKSTVKSTLMYAGILMAALVLYFGLRLNALHAGKVLAGESHFLAMIVNYPYVLWYTLKVALMHVSAMPLHTFETVTPCSSVLQTSGLILFYTAGTVIFAWGILKKIKISLFFLWIFLAMAPPAAAIVQTGIIDGHYFYMAAAGMALIIAQLIEMAATVPVFSGIINFTRFAITVAAAAVTFMMSGNFRNEFTFYESIIQIGNPSPIVYYNLGNAYVRTKQHSKAIIQYQRALHKAENQSQVYNNLSVALLQVKQPLQAEKASKKAVSAHPDNVRYIYNLVLAELTLGKEASALKNLKHIKDINSSYKPAAMLTKQICRLPGNKPPEKRILCK
jgi:tetratricopeptide (TPR) repeat protein